MDNNPSRSHDPVNTSPMNDQEFRFWNSSLASVQSQLAAPADGLSSEEVLQRRARLGPNVLRVQHQRALVLQFLSRFGNPLVIVLLAASGIAALTGDVASFAIIGVIVF